jgi:hypothetical protein
MKLTNINKNQSSFFGLIRMNKWFEDLKINPTIIKKRHFLLYLNDKIVLSFNYFNVNLQLNCF